MPREIVPWRHWGPFRELERMQWERVSRSP